MKPVSACRRSVYDLTPHIRSHGDEIEAKVRTPGWRARRWVVEACHSWLNRNRSILIRWSKKDENHLALLQLASGLIAFKYLAGRVGRGGAGGRWSAPARPQRVR